MYARLESPDDSETEVLFSIGEAVSMQLAAAVVSTSNQQRKTITHILLDCESHRSYITKVLADRLQLKSTKSEKLFVNTFGRHQTREVTAWTTQLRVLLNDGTSSLLPANIVSHFAKPIHHTPIQGMNSE